MHRLHLAPTLVLLTGLAGLAGFVAITAHASAPAGVWALVDEVTLEPDGKNPTLVRIDGVLMIANVQPDFPDYPGYSVPQKGYMYYSCEDKQLATCVMEWKELLAVAGTADNCRGWGSNSLKDNGSVRHPQVPPVDPDLYPVAQGVSPGFTPCEALRAWQMANPVDTTGGPDSEGDTDHTSTTEVETFDPSAGDTVGDDTTGGTASPDPTTGSSTTIEPTTGGPPESGTGSLTGQPGGESSGGATGSTGSGGSTGGAPIDDGGDKGCACNGGGGQGPAALVGLALLGLLRRRRG